MPKLIDLTGCRFGRLTVLSRAGKDKHGNIKWLCKCDCKKQIIVISSNLQSGHTRSCGCLQRKRADESNRTHGDHHSRLYHIWGDMKNRCTNPKNKRYESYGGRGIVICDEWMNYVSFRDWALSNGYNDSLTIDRIDNNKGYSPDNCRWADRRTQSNNTRRNRYITYQGRTLTIAQWAQELEISTITLWMRLNRGWSVEKALTTPPQPQKKKK